MRLRRDQFMAAVGQDGAHGVRGGFEMKLEAENAVVEHKGLTTAALALGQMDSALGQVKGVAVPVKHGRLLGQAGQQASILPGPG